MTPAEQLRDGQAMETWEHINGKTVAARDAQLRAPLNKAPSYEDLKMSVERHLAELKAKESALTAGTGDAAQTPGSGAQAPRRRGLFVPNAAATATPTKKAATPRSSPTGQGGPAARPRQRSLPVHTSWDIVSRTGTTTKAPSEASYQLGSAASAAEDPSELDVGKILRGEVRLGSKLNGVRA